MKIINKKQIVLTDEEKRCFELINNMLEVLSEEENRMIRLNAQLAWNHLDELKDYFN